MKITKFNMVAARTVAAGCVLGLFLGAQSAVACTVENWSADSDNVISGGPDTGLVRYSGLCAMETPESTVAWVQDNNPGGINRIRARFYVFNDLDPGQSAVIYRGFSDTGGSSNLFTVRLATDGTVRLIDNATGVEVQQTASTNWLSVEIDWAQGSGNGAISLSVDGQNPVIENTLGNTGSALQSVRLGNLLGAGGTLNFDAYESRRTTEVGRLLQGDANNDGAVTVFDAIAVVNEAAGTAEDPNLASGQPDCNEDGAVTVFDAICVINVASSI